MHPRKPPGLFLTRNGYTSHPPRELPLVADERELIEKIKARTTLRDEPECVGPAWLGDWAEVALLQQSQQHALDVAAMKHSRPLLKLEDRIKDIRRRAKGAHVDLSHETHIMQRDLERAKAGNRKPPLRVLERCERLEGLLDGIAA